MSTPCCTREGQRRTLDVYLCLIDCLRQDLPCPPLLKPSSLAMNFSSPVSASLLASIVHGGYRCLYSCVWLLCVFWGSEVRCLVCMVSVLLTELLTPILAFLFQSITESLTDKKEHAGSIWMSSHRQGHSGNGVTVNSVCRSELGLSEMSGKGKGGDSGAVLTCPGVGVTRSSSGRRKKWWVVGGG